MGISVILFSYFRHQPFQAIVTHSPCFCFAPYPIHSFIHSCEGRRGGSTCGESRLVPIVLYPLFLARVDQSQNPWGMWELKLSEFFWGVIVLVAHLETNTVAPCWTIEHFLRNKDSNLGEKQVDKIGYVSLEAWTNARKTISALCEPCCCMSISVCKVWRKHHPIWAIQFCWNHDAIVQLGLSSPADLWKEIFFFIFPNLVCTVQNNDFHLFSQLFTLYKDWYRKLCLKHLMSTTKTHEKG